SSCNTPFSFRKMREREASGYRPGRACPPTKTSRSPSPSKSPTANGPGFTGRLPMIGVAKAEDGDDAATLRTTGAFVAVELNRASLARRVLWPLAAVQRA